MNHPTRKAEQSVKRTSDKPMPTEGYEGDYVRTKKFVKRDDHGITKQFVEEATKEFLAKGGEITRMAFNPHYDPETSVEYKVIFNDVINNWEKL